MTTQDHFTPDEWTLLIKATNTAGLAAAAIDFGVVSVVKEMAASIKTLGDTAMALPTDSIVRAIIQADPAKDPAPGTGERMKADAVLSLLTSAATVAKTKMTKDESDTYCSLLIRAAEAGIQASGSGMFGTGEKVSPEEREFLDKLKGALAS